MIINFLLPCRFITIEGIDGVGKSTAVKMLAERIGGLAIQTPDPELDVERRKVEARGSISDKWLFYTAAMKSQRIKLKEKLQKNNLVCDRYIHSTLAYQWPRGKELPKNPRDIFPDLLWPDVSFLLTSDEFIRTSRLSHREFSEGKINKADHNKEVLGLAQERFLAMPDLIKIDTTNLSEYLVCEVLIDHLKEKYLCG